MVPPAKLCRCQLEDVKDNALNKYFVFGRLCCQFRIIHFTYQLVFLMRKSVIICIAIVNMRKLSNHAHYQDALLC